MRLSSATPPNCDLFGRGTRGGPSGLCLLLKNTSQSPNFCCVDPLIANEVYEKQLGRSGEDGIEKPGDGALAGLSAIY